MRRWWVIGLSVLVGCASPQVAMVHLKSRDIQYCKAAGLGAAPAILAQISVTNCVEQLEALGYKKAEDLTDEERAGLSPKPDLFEADIKIENK